MKTLCNCFLVLWMLVCMLIVPIHGHAGLNVILKGNTTITSDIDPVIPLPARGVLNSQKIIQACAWTNYTAVDTLVYDTDKNRCYLYDDFVNVVQPNIDNVWMLDRVITSTLPVLLTSIFENDSKAVVLYDSIQGCVSITGESTCPPAIAIAVPEGSDSGSNGGGGTTPPSNRAPVASSQSVTTDQDTPKPILLVANDPDGDALSYSIVSQPGSGVLTGTAPNVVYTPNTGVSGTDSFTFRASDGRLNSNTATVSIIINPVVVLPVVTDLSARAKDTKVSLVWTAIAGAQSYNVYRSTTQGGPYQKIAGNVVTGYATYLDSSLTNGVTYYYVVSVVIGNDESAYSNEAAARPASRSR